MKQCSKCNEWKQFTDFSPRRNSKDGLNGHCRQCIRNKNHGWRKSHPVDYYCSMMLAQAKQRAIKFSREFDLTLQDVKDLVVDTCPVFGTPLRWKYDHGEPRDDSPSLDRIDNSNGYVKGNVAIISARANTKKSDMTLLEAKAIARYMERPCKYLRPKKSVKKESCIRRHRVTKAAECEIIRLYHLGLSYRKIAANTGVSKSSVGYIVNRIRSPLSIALVHAGIA